MHPRLPYLLEKYNITPELFFKRGRPPKGVSEIRSAIITELHSEGLSWAELMAITGLSNGAIQRLTKAKRNPNTMAKIRSSCAELGRQSVGVKKPWFSESLRQWWLDGKFDFHRLPKSENHILLLKAGWTQSVRLKASASRKIWWADSDYRKRLLAYHRSPDVRRTRSIQQSMRMDHAPYIHGIRSIIHVKKCSNRHIIHTRSSYETAVVKFLETNDNTRTYEFEPTMMDTHGVLFPDFIVSWADNTTTLVEVKAQWVLSLPATHKVMLRLDRSRKLASANGWAFDIWTEHRVEVSHAI